MRGATLTLALLLAAGLLAGCGSRTFRGVEEDMRAVGSAVGRGIESVGQGIQRKSADPQEAGATETPGTGKDNGGAATSAPAPAKQ